MQTKSFFSQKRVCISYNVPAVYDGLAARISKTVGFAGLANCGCSEPWEPLGDLGERNPEPLQRRCVNSPVMRSRASFLFFFLSFPSLYHVCFFHKICFSKFILFSDSYLISAMLFCD